MVIRSNPLVFAALAREHLTNLSREQGVTLHSVLTRYGLERLLYRIGRSKNKRRFILKGRMLFPLWFDRPFWSVNHLDFLGSDDASHAELEEAFKKLCKTKVEPDGLLFDGDSVEVTEIGENQGSQRKRVELMTYLGSGRISLRINIAFGDAVTPGPKKIDYPTLLDIPAPKVRVYPPETVVAEKLQTITAEGNAKNPLQEIYKIGLIAGRLVFRGSTLVKAIKATFNHRNTPIPEAVSHGLLARFSEDPAKGKHWKMLVNDKGPENVSTDFRQVVHDIEAFLLPPLGAAAGDAPFSLLWKNGGPWS
jgi:hypothetical protein